MDKIGRCLVLICSILHCKGNNLLEQLEELQVREERAANDDEFTPSRRLIDFSQLGPIVGPPSYPSHLPEAEPILPGHTLIRPALGMLKSAIKFPHRDQDNGAGVYGNQNNLGIRYDGKNERVLYSGFRRIPADYIMIAPVKTNYRKPKFTVSTVVLDLDKNKNGYHRLLRNFRNLERAKARSGKSKNKRIIKVYSANRQKLIQPKLTSKKNRNRKESPYYPKHKTHFVHGNSEYGSPKKILRFGVKKSLRDNYDDGDVSLDVEHVKDTSDSNSFEKEDLSKEAKEKRKNRTKMFWDSKNFFTNIQVNPSAPDHAELMPANISDSIRSWWFYHQDDYQPFESNSL